MPCPHEQNGSVDLLFRLTVEEQGSSGRRSTISCSTACKEGQAMDRIGAARIRPQNPYDLQFHAAPISAMIKQPFTA